MALLDSEVARIKAELGYNVLSIGAEPRIDVVAIFDQVIKPYISAGASTTSTTSVTASSSGAVPVTLTLASATGFSSLNRVVIDVDDRQEVVTVQNVSGSTITIMLSLAHTGTYPVTVEGGETLVRQHLRRLATVGTRLDAASKTAGLKRAEDIEWYQTSSGSSSVYLSLTKEQMRLRDELGSMLGLPNMWRNRSGGGSVMSLY